MSEFEIYIKQGNLEKVKDLIKKGENINFQRAGVTPLQLSIFLKQSEIAEEILNQEGVQLDIQDIAQKTALHIAVETDNLDIVKKLIKKGANLNIKDENGRTPLHIALSQQQDITLSKAEKEKLQLTRVEIAKTLIENGAKYNISDKRGEKAIEIITKRELVDLLSIVMKKEQEQAKKHKIDEDKFINELNDFLGQKNENVSDTAIERFIKIKRGEDADLLNIGYDELIDLCKIYQFNHIPHTSDENDFVPITQEEIDSKMMNNEPIYVRSIRGLTGVIKDDSIKEDAMRMKYNETGGITEIQKLKRKKGKRTLTKMKGTKTGNPNRCFTIITYGKVKPFASVGYGTLDIDMEKIQLVANHDVFSIIDKEQGIINKNHKTEEDTATTTDNLDNKQKIDKIMQSIKESKTSLMHNEIVIDTTLDDVKFIYFYNKKNKENVVDSEKINYNKLQAIYFDRKYQEMTGRKIPIFEYKLRSNFDDLNEKYLEKIDFTKQEIKDMLKEEIVKEEDNIFNLSNGYNSIEAADFLLTFKDEIKEIPECFMACKNFCKQIPHKIEIYGIINFVKLCNEFREEKIEEEKLVNLLKEKIKPHHVEAFLKIRTDRRAYINKRENRRLDFWMYTVSQMMEVFSENIRNSISTDVIDTTREIYLSNKVLDNRNRQNVGVILSNQLLTGLKDRNIGIVKELILGGVNVNIKDEHGINPLMCACMLGEQEIVELLLKHGANVNEKNNAGFSALHYCRTGVSIAQLLIDFGADVNAKTNNGDTVLKYALMNRNKQMVKLLIENGANVNFEERLGESPLIMAVKTGDKDIVEALLKENVKTDVVDRLGMTPMDIAKRGRSENEIIEILEKYGVIEEKANTKSLEL